MKEISPQGVGIRFIFALILVLLTYNPSGFSFVHWAANAGFAPLVLLAGVALLIGWIIYIRATLRSLGTIGLILAAVFFGALVWLFISWGWISLQEAGGFTWVILIILAAILAIGMSWSHIRRRMSGQMDTDDV
ncbi:hypothetical protein E2K93_01080 [Thalassotalea sp. HSM 43]|uniref:DUF6524 family protein n=1 Tax=Thalassotalea sp. HSM 43 TaxID=2552945 RepID=UPI001080E9FE|nr:DUF6524 family protein [Thalassotalea sp. HSM 43]QBY03046.1 hypothetical protein E2K93_01080 [Thalassotalea sp. HSM 43]